MADTTFEFHQVQIYYSPEEDRIILKVNSRDDQQFSMAFTRRFTKTIWPVLLDVLISDPLFAGYDNATKQAAADFKNQEVLASADLEKPFQEDNLTYPWGQTPLIAAMATLSRPPEGLLVLGIYAQNKVGFEFPANHHFLHYLYKGLLDLEKATEWDLSLAELSSQSMKEIKQSRKKLN